MAMGVIWTALAAAALVCGAVNGRLDAVTAAALEGAGAAVELVLTMAGAMCLWCGVMELLRRSGLASSLARRLRPVLGRLLPGAARDREAMEAVMVLPVGLFMPYRVSAMAIPPLAPG